jgi:hypothetical protein
MLRIAQKKTKRSFALRLVGVLWTESRVCRSLLGFEVRLIRLRALASIGLPFLWNKVCPPRHLCAGNSGIRVWLTCLCTPELRGTFPA